jgi:hypothetical protein
MACIGCLDFVGIDLPCPRSWAIILVGTEKPLTYTEANVQTPGRKNVLEVSA